MYMYNNLILYSPDASYLNFLGDDFLRLLLCRYIFADVTLRIHRAFKVGSTRQSQTFQLFQSQD